MRAPLGRFVFGSLSPAGRRRAISKRSSHSDRSEGSQSAFQFAGLVLAPEYRTGGRTCATFQRLAGLTFDGPSCRSKYPRPPITILAPFLDSGCGALETGETLTPYWVSDIAPYPASHCYAHAALELQNHSRVSGEFPRDPRFKSRRALIPLPSIPILIVTLEVTAQLVKQAKSVGIRGAVQKSGTIEVLKGIEAPLRRETFFEGRQSRAS